MNHVETNEIPSYTVSHYSSKLADFWISIRADSHQQNDLLDWSSLWSPNNIILATHEIILFDQPIISVTGFVIQL